MQTSASTSGALTIAVVQFNEINPTGVGPIDLLLRLLTSTTGLNGNGTHDVYGLGVGLGIPQDQLDLDSFNAIKNSIDADAKSQLFFRITNPEPAKEFIDSEICRPFGLYLATRNDGRIRCLRSRNPELFYVGEGNRYLTVRPTSTTSYTGTLPVGVFTPEQMCANVKAALDKTGFNSHCHTFTCTWDAIDHKFSLEMETRQWNGSVCTTVVEDSFDILVTGTAVNAWTMLGWGSTVNDVPDAPHSEEAPASVGVFTTTDVLTKDDMWGLRMIDNLDDRITSVTYEFDHQVGSDSFRSKRHYSDPEHTGLEDIFGPRDYQIRSRGLVSGGPNSAGWPAGFSNVVNCVPIRMYPELASGVNADTWSKLHAHTLINRYKQPPIKFRAKLKWRWNHLEVGDMVRVNYDIRGVLVDHERNMDWIENRIFEIVELHPNFDGSLDATFLGFRYVD